MHIKISIEQNFLENSFNVKLYFSANVSYLMGSTLQQKHSNFPDISCQIKSSAYKNKMEI